MTVRYIRRWLAGWLLFRWLAPGFADRVMVLGNLVPVVSALLVAVAGVLAWLSAEGGTGSADGQKKFV
ncbi:hypothetical protein ACYCFC_15340 [Stutzerimonas sp. NM35]